jgi:hypothetical protein
LSTLAAAFAGSLIPPRAPSFATGVGQDEHALTWVWRAHRTSRDESGTGSVSKPIEVMENIGKSEFEQTGHVLTDDPDGSDGRGDLEHGGPEPAGIGLRQAATRLADRLAGEAAGDHVNGRSVCSQPPVDAGSDIVMTWHLRPMFREYPAAERVDLDLADHGHAGPLKAQVQAADASEQRQHVHDASGWILVWT